MPIVRWTAGQDTDDNDRKCDESVTPFRVADCPQQAVAGTKQLSV
jgi:hypothetical protein